LKDSSIDESRLAVKKILAVTSLPHAKIEMEGRLR
jgi:hypothetical protein